MMTLSALISLISILISLISILISLVSIFFRLGNGTDVDLTVDHAGEAALIGGRSPGQDTLADGWAAPAAPPSPR